MDIYEYYIWLLKASINHYENYVHEIHEIRPLILDARYGEIGKKEAARMYEELIAKQFDKQKEKLKNEIRRVELILNQ